MIPFAQATSSGRNHPPGRCHRAPCVGRGRRAVAFPVTPFLRGAILVAGLSAAGFGAMGLGVASAQTEGGATPDRPPVLLRQTELMPPPESAGSGAQPEVKLKVTLDQRGAPQEVEVLEIKERGESGPEPLSADLVEAFRQHTMEEVGLWRWAPAIEDGKAVPRTLEWSVQYQSLSQDEVQAYDGLPMEILVDKVWERRDRIGGLPLELKKKLLLRYAAEAEKALDKEKRRQVDSQSFVVVTDADNPKTAEILANNLEVALRLMRGIFQPAIEPHPNSLKTVVYVYRSRASLDAAQHELTAVSGYSGFYLAPGLVLYHLEVPSAEHVLSILVHETSHAYSDQYLRRPGVDAKTWFEEGFAEYMGNSEIKKGELIPGKTLRRKYVLDHMRGGARLQTTIAGWDLKSTRRALKDPDSPSIHDVVTAERSEFYGGSIQTYYGLSWALVHFLRHGEEGWAAGPFSQLALYLSEGYPSLDAIEAAYGQTLEELEPKFLDHLDRL